MPKTKSSATIGERLRAARVAAEMTQAALAAASGVTQGHISAIESRGRSPLAVHLAKLARALGVSVDSLLPD